MPKIFQIFLFYNSNIIRTLGYIKATIPVTSNIHHILILFLLIFAYFAASLHLLSSVLRNLILIGTLGGDKLPLAIESVILVHQEIMMVSLRLLLGYSEILHDLTEGKNVFKATFALLAFIKLICFTIEV